MGAREFRLQAFHEGQWETVPNGTFASELEAASAGDELRERDEFAERRMRVVDPDGGAVVMWERGTLGDIRRGLG